MPTISGLIYSVSAPSGAGKTSLVKALLEQDAHLEVSVSHTTRPIRPGEVDGKHYHFVDEAAFLKLRDEDGFVEHAKVFEHWYGTSVQSIETILSHGHDIILDIDWQGAKQIRESFPEQSVSIFLLPPSIEALRERLIARGQDSEDTVNYRMERSKAEMKHYADADYLIINDDFDKALADLQSIVRVRQLRVPFQQRHNGLVIEQLLS